MISWITKTILVIATIVIVLCLAVSLPPGQRLAKDLLQKAFRDSGLDVSAERITCAFPLFIRFDGFTVQDSSREGSPLLTCSRLSVSPLLLDLPFQHFTLINLQGRGITVDTDAIEAYTKKLAQNNSGQAWSFRILRANLTSIHATSQRLSAAIDCSLKGRGSLSQSQIQLRLAVSRNIPTAWPEKIWVSVDKDPHECTIAASITLSTLNFPDYRNRFFGPKDRLDISLHTFLNDFGTIQQASGLWNLHCPEFTLSLPHEYQLHRTVEAQGAISYEPKQPLHVSIERSHKNIVLSQMQQPITVIDGEFQAPIIKTIAKLTSEASGEIECRRTGEEAGQLSISLPSLSVNGLHGSLSGTILGSFGEGRYQASSSFDGTLSDGSKTYPLCQRGTIDADDQRFALAYDILVSPFMASVRSSIEHESKTIQTSLRCQDFSYLEPLIGTPISGSGQLSAKLSGTSQFSDLSCSASVSDFQWNDIECLDGDIRISTQLPSANSFSLTANCIKARAGALRLNELHTAVSGELKTHLFQLTEAKISGSIRDLPFDLLGCGEGHTTGHSGSLAIHRLEGTIGGEELCIDQPIRIEHTNSLISKLVVDLRIGASSRLSGEWIRPVSEKLIGSISVENLSLAHAAAIFGSPNAKGTVNGQCHFQSIPGDLSASASLQANIARLGVLGGEDGGLALGGTVSIDRNIGTGELCIAGTGVKEPLLVAISAPVTHSSRFPFIAIQPQTPLSGSIKGDVLLSQLLGGWLPDQAGFDAIIGCNASIDGTFDDPLLHGSAHVREGRIDLLPTGEVIKNIEMDGTIEGRRIALQHITASDENEGSIEGAGAVELTPANEFHWDATVTCSVIEAVCLDYAKVTADAKVVLNGNLDGMAISGSAVSRKALIDLAARFPSDTPEIPVVYLNEHLTKSNPFKIFFDLSIDSSSGIEVSGRGLSSCWTGHLHLKGEADQLFIDGNLRCQRGTFSLSNKELTISEGTATVAGDLFKDSRLNVVAKIDHPAVTAQVNLRGSLESPKISIQSTPPRPDTETLSLILFNKEFGDISPLQSLQLANTAMTLQQSSGPFGLVDRMKENLGIDLIDFGTAAPGALPSNIPSSPSALDPSDTGPPSQIQNDVSIKVGKYISEGVAVTVSKDVTSDANYIGFEAQLAPDISAGGQVGDDQAGIVSLKWKKNY